MDTDSPLLNGLLSRLPADEWERLRDHAEPFTFHSERSLFRPGDRYDAVYFPSTGLVSLVSTTEGGHNVEVWAVGREGAVAAVGLALQVDRSPSHVIVSVPSTGYRIGAEPFLRLWRELPALQTTALAYAGRVLVGMGATMACNRFHSLRQRLAKWLLIATNKTGETKLSLTHDFLAQMVGGPRHAVTAAMNDLRIANAISYARGDIEIVDPVRLAAEACECHGIACNGT